MKTPQKIVLLVLVVATGFVQAIDKLPLPEDPATLERYQTLTEELRCLVCQNQTLADSNADLAVDMRREVLRMIDEGMSNQEIRDWLVVRYGDFVLYRPPMKGSTLFLWFGPLLLLLLAGAAAFVAMRRYRRDGGPNDPPGGSGSNTDGKPKPDIKDLLDDE